MKNTYLVWYNNRDEKDRLIRAFSENGYRIEDESDIYQRKERYAFSAHPAGKTVYYVRPTIGAAASSGGIRFYTADEMMYLLEKNFSEAKESVFR